MEVPVGERWRTCIKSHHCLTRAPLPSPPPRGWREQDKSPNQCLAISGKYPRLVPSPSGGGLGWGHRAARFFVNHDPAPSPVGNKPGGDSWLERTTKEGHASLAGKLLQIQADLSLVGAGLPAIFTRPQASPQATHRLQASSYKFKQSRPL